MQREQRLGGIRFRVHLLEVYLASSRLRSSLSDEDDNDVKGEVDREVSSPRCRSTVALTGKVLSQEHSLLERGVPKSYLKAEVSASCVLRRERTSSRKSNRTLRSGITYFFELIQTSLNRRSRSSATSSAEGIINVTIV